MFRQRLIQDWGHVETLGDLLYTRIRVILCMYYEEKKIRVYLSYTLEFQKNPVAAGRDARRIFSV